MYKIIPSELMGIEDPYTSYCFNEAVAYIVQMIDEGMEPLFDVRYSSFTDMYKDY